MADYIDIGTQAIDPTALASELRTAGIPAVGIGITGPELRMYDASSALIMPTLEAEAVVDAHVPPPRTIDYAGSTTVDALARTTDDVPLEVFRFPCAEKHLYRADLIVSGVDAGNFVSRIMEGRFTWKRTTGNAVMVGITIVSNLGDTASSTWAPNAAPSGTDIVFTVKGAAGRTIDWFLTGQVGRYAPEGLPQ